VAAPTGAETVAETTMQTSALSTNSINPAAGQMGSQSVAPRVSRARRSAAPAATDDTTSAPAVTQPSETPAAPTRRRATRAAAPNAAPAELTELNDAGNLAATSAAARPTRRRTTRGAQAAPLTSEAARGSNGDYSDSSEPAAFGASGQSQEPTTPAEPGPPLRRRFDVRPRGPYGRATAQPASQPAQPQAQAQEAQPQVERFYGQPAASSANTANDVYDVSGGQQPTGRNPQGGGRGSMPYSPGGRGGQGGERHGRGEQSRQQPRQPQYPQQGQQYPAGQYSGQRQGRDDQRGGQQPYPVYPPAGPYAPVDPYSQQGQQGQRGQRGQQDQGQRGQRTRGGQQGYPQQGSYADTSAHGTQGRGYPQERQDQRDQRRQGGRHNDQGYQNQPNQGGYPQERQDRRGGNVRGGQPGRSSRSGREQMTLPPIYTNPNANNATIDSRYAPYQPMNQRAQPPAPQQHARTVEIAGMVYPSGHGAATADILDERTLQTTGRITLDDMRRWGLRSGDVIRGQVEERGNRRALVALDSVNDDTAESAHERPHFDQLTATFPDRRARLEQSARPISARIIDLFAPLGFGSRALIVAPPKTGKTTLIREAAESVLLGYPDAVVMAVLVGERPEEVTDLRSRLEPRGGHVYAASFDESTERHAWLTQVAVERAKRVAESGRDAFMVLDSLTRLARAENLASRGGGRTLSGGIDAQALDTGRRAFGAARNLEEGGSITILATCLVDTGSRQDDVVYEEFKGTGNMELHLSRELSQRRLFPSVDAVKSGTRREELLLTPEELRGATTLRRLLADKPTQAATQWLLDAMERTPSNATLLNAIEQQTGVRAR
jgi:transcription termination factor Rho